MANQKVSETISLLALVTLMLLSSSVSSFSIPRVTRTKDAIIIDCKNLIGIFDIEFHLMENDLNSVAGGVVERQNYEIPYNPAVGFVPNPLMYLQEQQSTIRNGWPYFFSYPGSFTSPATELSGAGQQSEELVKQGTTTIQCGRGPTTFPKTSNSQQQSMSLISARFTGGNQASKNKWPFMVYTIISI
jgi:hypothetical protein